MDDALQRYRAYLAQGDKTYADLLAYSIANQTSHGPALSFRLQSGLAACKELYEAHVASLTPPTYD